MAYIEAKRKIEKGEIAPVYTLVGTEPFMEKDLIQAIVHQVLNEHEREYNFSAFDMRDTPVHHAIEEALTLPFFGERKVVVIKDAYFLTGQKAETDIEHDIDRLMEYINHPVIETIFIITVPYEKLDERKKICKLLLKQSEFVELKEFKEEDLFDWLDEQCGAFGVKLTKEAKMKLIQLVGNNLALLVNELEKLALFVGEGGVIEAENVERLVAKSTEQNVFDLIDFLLNKRIGEALELFDELLTRKEEPIVLLALLGRQVRLLYQVRYLSQTGYLDKQIAGQLKLHPYVVKLLREKGKAFSNETLLKLLQTIAGVDYEIKSGRKEKRLAVELLLMRFYEMM